MRKLTLDEKINFKLLLERKGISPMPDLEMADVLRFWRICYGTLITKWFIIPNKGRI